MLQKLTTVNVWVHDQDEALAFYTEKLGMEVRADVTPPEMGGFRWLAVGLPGQDDVALALLPVPGPPVFDDETRQALETLVAKGAAGGLFFSVADCRASYEELRRRGVEFSQEPTEQPTASTPASATRPGTRCGWPSSPRETGDSPRLMGTVPEPRRGA